MRSATVARLGCLHQGGSFTTLDLKIKFLRPFWSGRLVATARTVKTGRRIGLVRGESSEGR